MDHNTVAIKKERIIAFRKARWVNYIYENPSGYRWTRVKHKMYLENHLGYKPEVVTKCTEQEFLEMLFDEL